MKFMLEIELGNETMMTDEHIRRALSLLGRAFTEGQDGTDIRDAGKIKDINGNLVGKWEVREDSKPKLPSKKDVIDALVDGSLVLKGYPVRRQDGKVAQVTVPEREK